MRRPSVDSTTSNTPSVITNVTSATQPLDHPNPFAPQAGAPTSPTSSSTPKIILHTSHRRSSVPSLAQRPGFLRDSVQSSNGATNGVGGGPYTARLVYHTSHGGKMNFRLDEEMTNIGRKDDNNIVLTCAKISKYHAVIKRGEKGYLLKDRNSSNGVKVNDIPIQPGTFSHLLKHQDVILIGTISLIFVEDRPPPTPAATPPTSLTSSPIHNRTSLHPTSPTTTTQDDSYLQLVTILPSEQKYEETVTIRAELPADDDTDDFLKISALTNLETLKQDYEKLRLAYELSKLSVTNDITSLLAKSLNLMFEILPVDRGVVLLVDKNTGILATHYVKLREGKANEEREILLSSTILRKVYYTRKCLITSDACEDPLLGKAASVKTGQIRSVICVPLIAHKTVHGILHLDSHTRINSFSAKDLSLVKAVSNQTALAIENTILVKEVEMKARVEEQLSRFLPGHVVERLMEGGRKGGEIIRKGGRMTEGTIVFVDIRGFTNLSEKCGTGEVVNLLNDYFERLVKIVFKYEGVVDKYIGDALMAAFGTLDHETDSEYRAVAASLEFVQAIEEMNVGRVRDGKEAIKIGVGVNTGELLAGFIGSQQRLEYTCIGDTVNTSSRICSMASVNQVLISETTYRAVKGRVEVESVGMRQFKGKQKEVMVYEATGLVEVEENL
ncbi:hypothetical protein HDV00_006737 [Rhizophlyctis rosea]|nr:hypothetical protein HDV00_006737 [Rhizophlyctis rosea]